MSEAMKVSEKIDKLSLPELLRLAAMALENNLSDSHVDFVFIHLETALQKRSLLKQLGLTPDTKE